MELSQDMQSIFSEAGDFIRRAVLQVGGQIRLEPVGRINYQIGDHGLLKCLCGGYAKAQCYEHTNFIEIRVVPAGPGAGPEAVGSVHVCRPEYLVCAACRAAAGDDLRFILCASDREALTAAKMIAKDGWPKMSAQDLVCFFREAKARIEAV